MLVRGFRFLFRGSGFLGVQAFLGIQAFKFRGSGFQVFLRGSGFLGVQVFVFRD